MPSATAFP